MFNYVSTLFASTKAVDSPSLQPTTQPLSYLTPQQQQSLIDNTVHNDMTANDDINEYIMIDSNDIQNNNNNTEQYIDISRTNALSEEDEADSPIVSKKYKKRGKHHSTIKQLVNNNDIVVDATSCNTNNSMILTQLYDKINTIEKQIQIDQLYHTKSISNNNKTRLVGKPRVTDELLFGCY